MNILKDINIKDAFFYPLRDKKWKTKIFIGMCFHLIGTLFIITLIPVAGYTKKIIDSSITSSDNILPDWQNTFFTGIPTVIIYFFYYLVPLFIIISLGIFINIDTLSKTTETIAGLMLLLIYAVILPIITNIALCIYSHTKKFLSAFNILKISILYLKNLKSYIALKIFKILFLCIPITTLLVILSGIDTLFKFYKFNMPSLLFFPILFALSALTLYVNFYLNVLFTRLCTNVFRASL